MRKQDDHKVDEKKEKIDSRKKKGKKRKRERERERNTHNERKP